MVTFKHISKFPIQKPLQVTSTNVLDISNDLSHIDNSFYLMYDKPQSFIAIDQDH